MKSTVTGENNRREIFNLNASLLHNLNNSKYTEKKRKKAKHWVEIRK